MLELCNVDGRVTPLAEATVPVMDRGFLFGDSVYEVVRTRQGIPFAWPEHVSRLQASAAALAIPLQPGPAELARRVRGTLEAAQAGGGGEAYVRIVLSRGTGSAPNIDVAAAPGPSRCVIIVRAAPPPPARGARVAVVTRLRVDRRALDPAIKSGNYLNNVLGLMEAKAAGADDCVFLNQAGEVTEASTSNVFLVRGGEVLTPPLEAGILAGVTRGLVLATCAREKIPAREESFGARGLRAAEELFLSSTLRDVWPVVELDGEPRRSGAPGSLVERLARAFARVADELVATRYRPAWEALARG